MNQILKKKNLKPIESDVNFKYRCPKPECGYYHWLSLKEAQTKNFKIVCDCGTVFKPKQISIINIVYAEDDSTKKDLPKQSDSQKLENNNADNSDILTISTNIPSMPEQLNNKCVKLLVEYGFTEQESKKIAQNAYKKLQINDPVCLVRQIMQKLEEYDE